MNTTQHTPGKWVAHGCTVATADLWKDGNNLGGATVAITYQPDSDTCPCDEMLANARLIAAAPELLAACQSLLHFAELTGWGDLALAGSGNEQRDTISIQTMELARKAVAQATGNEIPTPTVSENLNQPLK